MQIREILQQCRQTAHQYYGYPQSQIDAWHTYQLQWMCVNNKVVCMPSTTQTSQHGQRFTPFTADQMTDVADNVDNQLKPNRVHVIFACTRWCSGCHLRMSSSQRRSAKASPKPASCTMSMILPQLKVLCLSTNLLSFSKVESSGWPCRSGLQQARHCRNSSACKTY